MNYLKLRTHGTGKDIIPPLNPYRSKNLDTGIKVSEIYKNYHKYRPKPKKIWKGKRLAKRRTAKDDYSNMYEKIFIYAIHYIIMGIINSEFRFVFPSNRGSIHLKEVINKKAYYSKYKLDPFECNLKAYTIQMRILYSRGTKVSRVFVSNYYTNILNNNLKEDKVKIQAKELTLMRLASIVRNKLYPKLERTAVYNILRYGFKILSEASVNDIDTVVFHSFGDKAGTNKIIFKTTDPEGEKIALIARKFRYLYKASKIKYSGYYYFALTHEEFNLFKTRDTEVVLYRNIEEAMLKPLMRPHIFRIKEAEPLFRIHKIYRTIEYEKNNTKYIWRWNDKGFEPVNNSKLRTN